MVSAELRNSRKTDNMQNIISLLLLLTITACSGYLWVIAIASVRKTSTILSNAPLIRIAIAIPAHNEEAVIGQTVAKLKHQNYPLDLFDVFVVADFCSDQTAQDAREQGAICFERNSGERGQKGTALQWLFERIFERADTYDAVVVFDADTLVDANFLRYMSARISQGAIVVQGKHVISNPEDGWVPALDWALMTINNRFSNQGRANLKLSAMNMGDSICFRSEVIKKLGYGRGLAEDYQFRFRLLLENIRIEYEPSAIGYGQAPVSLKIAQHQHTRWRKGSLDAHAQYGKEMLFDGITQKNMALLDGAIGSSIPSYSTLTLTTIIVLLIQILFFDFFSPPLTYLLGGMTFLWFVYPLLGLYFEKAPLWAYLVILSGPFFIVWRTWIVLRIRLAPQTITWVRTPHKSNKNEH
jgi:cellulose synthase/poly-beta-1,6-N-acetylglucosamine synthase-like glycosyltransferase